ncbi:protein lethal(2)denticleless [Coccinella septempunctata]|uniref:protein lethal(2)denticleless n=1 Tax=Coccinella septempunctata TaxID=41139 RepID=UPI001D08FA68|nr:protein lethal(2)denticleless [Coccinella septempunctata]
MHPVIGHFNQQYGHGKYKSYEPYLERLRCLKNDSFTQIYPSVDLLPDSPIFACKFSERKNFEHILALANEDGKIGIQNVKKGEERIGLRAHNNAIFDLTWLFQQMKIVTASGDHSSKLYDVSSSGIREESTFLKHERSVKSIASSRDDPSIFATGGRDGNIIVWDIRAENPCNDSLIGKSDILISKSHVTKAVTPSRNKKNVVLCSQNNSVTGLAFQNSNTLISCGAGDGCVKVWDLRKTHYNSKRDPLPRYTLPYPGKSARHGYSNLIIDSENLRLYVNCLDSSIYCYNIGTYNVNPIMTYTGHQNNTFYIKSALSKDGSYLISGSSDENAYIWNLKHPEPICKLTGHTAEVTCVAWYQSTDPCIVTCSDDIKHKLWKIGTEDLPENFEIEGQGKAEILPLFNSWNKPRLKRHLVNKDLLKNIPKKFINSCERCLCCTDNERFCENCNHSNKRKVDDEISPSKRLNSQFGPRKLFANLVGIQNLDQNNPNKRKFSDLSPLKDLPNYVMDGVAPHLNFSPPKKKHCDWLTKLRIDYSFKRKMLETSGELNAKIAKLETTPKSKTSTKTLAQKSPLLRYFKMTNNSSKSEKLPSALKGCNDCDNLGNNNCMHKQ